MCYISTNNNQYPMNISKLIHTDYKIKSVILKLSTISQLRVRIGP